MGGAGVGAGEGQSGERSQYYPIVMQRCVQKRKKKEREKKNPQKDEEDAHYAD